MNYLTHTADEYFAGVKYFKQLGQMALREPERSMALLALEALRYAAVRMENPPLTLTHLKQMHGQPVYCSSWTGGPTGGGIINTHKEQVILLDHSGVWYDTWFWNSTGKYFRFPLNGVDLLGTASQIDKTCRGL